MLEEETRLQERVQLFYSVAFTRIGLSLLASPFSRRNGR